MVLAGGGQRGEAHSGITTETEGGEDEALDEKWINPDEADDIAASKFLCGGSLTTKEGRMVWFGLVWYGGRGRGEVPWYIGTGPPQTDTWKVQEGRCLPISSTCYLTA